MDNITLYQFIIDNDLESRWDLNGGILDVILFVNVWNIEDFHEILPSNIFDDEGITCWMKDGYFAFWMNDICNYCGIEIEKVFPETSDKKRLVLEGN